MNKAWGKGGHAAKVFCFAAFEVEAVGSSFLAWFTAFSISIEFTCETMSNQGMTAGQRIQGLGKSSEKFYCIDSAVGPAQSGLMMGSSVLCPRRRRVVRIVPWFFMLSLLWATLLSGQSETPPAEKWATVLDFSESSPAIGSGGRIYLGTFHQKLWAVNSNGVPQWNFKTGSDIKSSPAIGSDGTIYFGCRDRKFYALSPQGKKKWEFATGAWVDSSPALGRDGTIYFGSWDNSFYALSPDGSLKWRFQTAGEIDSSPAVGMDGSIYFGSHDKSFYALTPEGRKRWAFATGGQIFSSPALDGSGVVYFTSVDGFIYAVNQDGRLQWRLHTGGSTESSPVIGPDGTIYVGVNYSLWAIRPDGGKKWVQPVTDIVQASPVVVAENQVYVAARPALLAFDAEGHPRWEYNLSFTYLHPLPAIGGDGTIYLIGRFNTLMALGAHAPLARAPWPKFRASAGNSGRVKDAAP